MIYLCMKFTFMRDYFKSLWSVGGKISKYLAWEAELIFDIQTLLHLKLEHSFRCDHAGVCLEVGAFGLIFFFRKYDTRHWDEKTGTFL